MAVLIKMSFIMQRTWNHCNNGYFINRNTKDKYKKISQIKLSIMILIFGGGENEVEKSYVGSD